MDKAIQLIISCEHSANNVPEAYLYLFNDYFPILESHWAFDQGAKELAEKMSFVFSTPLFAGKQTRLLVDLNRSLNHPRLFSGVTKNLLPSEKQSILQKYYFPYRKALETEVANQIKKGRQVFHLSVHSFTPVFNREIRQGDIGLLYDAKRQSEKNLSITWQKIIKTLRPDLTIRRNYPYLGTSDGVASYLRRQHPEESYIGLELEVNQKHYFHCGTNWEQLKLDLVISLQQLFHTHLI